MLVNNECVEQTVTRAGHTTPTTYQGVNKHKNKCVKHKTIIIVIIIIIMIIMIIILIIMIIIIVIIIIIMILVIIHSPQKKVTLVFTSFPHYH